MRLRHTIVTSRTAGVCALVLLSSCLVFGELRPRAHTMRKYRESPELARAIEARAASECEARRSVRPEHAFHTDGCTLWIDGSWGECCVEHDLVYWCGGSREERQAADRALRACVQESGNSVVSWVMYPAVRLGGGPWTGAPWRWGFGFDGSRRYGDPQGSLDAAAMAPASPGPR